jgi:putative ABC transport system substrate-binding protein
MRRREFITLVGGAVAAWPLAGRAERPAMPVVGFMGVAPRSETPHLFARFDQGLADAGYVEGKNLTIEYRFANRLELMAEAAGDLVRRNASVIFAGVPDAVAAAREATTSIPIVGVDLESDPLAKGYVKSLARPGGNITGMFLDLPELGGKQIGLLKEIVPRLSRIAIFGIPGLNVAQFAATEKVARAHTLEAEVMEVHVANDFEQAFVSARTKRVDAGILLSSPLVFVASKQIGELAVAKRLPLICLFAEFPKSGGLISYGPNVAEIYGRAGEYVAKILHGAKPSDLPIQRPEKFDLVINLKTPPPSALMCHRSSNSLPTR